MDDDDYGWMRFRSQPGRVLFACMEHITNTAQICQDRFPLSREDRSTMLKITPENE